MNLYNKVPFLKKVLADGRSSRGRINPRNGPGSRSNGESEDETNKKGLILGEPTSVFSAEN